MTGSAAGAAVERSGSWISRVEGGRVGLRGCDLQDLLDLYGMHDARRREELEALAREGKQRGWWSKYTEQLPALLVVYIGLEDEARAIRGYQDDVVPGLLQTERYCRAVIQQCLPVLHPLSSAEIESRVEVQMTRQARLHEKPLQLHCLVDEAVLYRTIGGTEVLGEQLGHLLMVAREPHIDIRTIPFAHGDRIIPTGAFSILSFSHDPDTVWLEPETSRTYLDEGEDLDVCSQVFDRMTAAALEPQETENLIEKARQQLTLGQR
jgi:hypothetical protein